MQFASDIKNQHCKLHYAQCSLHKTSKTNTANYIMHNALCIMQTKFTFVQEGSIYVFFPTIVNYLETKFSNI